MECYIEFWYARELQLVLNYKEWRKFENVINKAKESCKNSDINVFEHFVDVDKTIKMPKGATKNIRDYKLTRYACYLIAQNGDTRKKEANKAHYEVGSKIRKTIKELGGTMPEELPTPKKSLKQLEKEKKRTLKSGEMKMIKQSNNVMELWEVLDDKGNATGEIMEKYDQKVFDKGFYHLAADVWIINDDNKILIQKRAKQKRLQPNVWAMTGGSVILGENSISTIVREAKEELDIDINADDLILITKFKTENIWVDTYILKCNYDISKMKFQEDEVSDVKWATWAEINDLVNKGQFIKHRWQFVSKVIQEEIK